MDVDTKAVTGSKYFGGKAKQKPNVYSLSGKLLEKLRFKDLRHDKTPEQAKEVRRRRRRNKIAKNSRRANR